CLYTLLLPTNTKGKHIDKRHSVVEARLCPNIELYFEYYSEKGQRKGGFDSHWRQHFATALTYSRASACANFLSKNKPTKVKYYKKAPTFYCNCFNSTASSLCQSICQRNY